ncbi:MAG: DJ-1/PfpI family protein [Spirochaetota bacterium]
MKIKSILIFVVVLVMLIHCSSGPSHIFVNKTDSGAMQTDPQKSILFVLSATHTKLLRNGKTYKTGFFLSEFYEPYKMLKDQGYSIVIATTDGSKPVVDPESLKKKYWKENPQGVSIALDLVKNSAEFKNVLSLRQVLTDLDRFAGLVIPGGQGLMDDLLMNQEVHLLINKFGKANKPVGLVCHAPAILIHMKPAENPFFQRKLTSVSNIEEWYIETFVMDGKAIVRDIGGILDKQGYQHSNGFPGSSYAVADCNLVTNQNPFSGNDFNEKFLQAVKMWESGAECVKGIQ